MRIHERTMRHMIPALVLSAFILFLTANAFPQTPSELEKLAGQFEEIKQAAEKGSGRSQFVLGMMYRNGIGTPRDVKTGFEWLMKSADNGWAEAQMVLGNAYRSGKDVPKNDMLAVYWYRKAAELDNAAAQTNLGAMYSGGAGVERDYKEALKWFEKAAEKDFPPAKNNLAWFLATCPEDGFRNGKKSLEIIKSLPEDRISEQSIFLDTLAAAYAENGMFDEAVATQRKAIEQTAEAPNPQLFKQLQSRLESYRNRKPWRETGEDR